MPIITLDLFKFAHQLIPNFDNKHALIKSDHGLKLNSTLSGQKEWLNLSVDKDNCTRYKVSKNDSSV